MKTPKKKENKNKLVYGRPKLVELPEPTLEREPEATDKNHYSVMFGTRRVDARVSPTQLVVSLRDLYRNHHKSLRNQITWRELSEVSGCEDPTGKGWVDLETAVSILKRCGTFKMFRAMFKLEFRKLAKEILLEEERQELKREAQHQDGSNEEDDAGEEEDEESTEETVDREEDEVEVLEPQRARAKRFYKSQNELVEDAEDIMGKLEAEYAENLSYHLWWSYVMREEFREKHAYSIKKPRTLRPAIKWGSWPRPYSVIGTEPTKYVDVDDPTGGGLEGPQGGAPAAFMLDLPEVYPRFDFTVPLLGARTMQNAANWISAKTPDIDMIKAYQVEERAFFASDGELERMSKLQEEEEEEEEEEEDEDETDEEPVSTVAPNELSFFDGDEYGQIMDLVDPNPDDFNPEVFKEAVEEPPKFSDYQATKERRKAYDEAPAIPKEKNEEYFLDGLKSLQIGLNASYQRAIYDRIHERRREDGASIEPATLTSPQMPQQCMAEVKSMLDDMLKTAATSMSTFRNNLLFRRHHRVLDWDNIGAKYSGVGRTRERMVTLFGEPKPVEGRPSAAERQAEVDKYEREEHLRSAIYLRQKKREKEEKEAADEGEASEEEEEEEEEVIPVKGEDGEGDVSMKETQPQPLSAQLQYAIKLAREGKVD